ncbi:MAG: SRPBCC family protein [Sphingobacteriales bacterium]|nr:SRPBCC family protein [Sphingobacteriales bacterium]MBI3718589.1 SRPBCC family protein [Sphingobacteriales bacterium]
MKTIERTEIFNAMPEQVFKCIDDLGVSGMHMTKSSMMMMGSKLNLEYLTEKHAGPGTKYRWMGKMMGMPMDFTVEVTKWIAGKEKIWETIDNPKMIIYSWHQMHLITTPMYNNGTEAELSISYEKPKGFFYKILSFLFADWYCNWCLNRMLDDVKLTIELPVINNQLLTNKI